MNRRRFGKSNIKVIARAAVITYVMLFASMIATAQSSTPENAPPPVSIISKDERTKLTAKQDLKDRTRLAIDLMDLRLDLAEKLHTEGQYDEMFDELGGFQGLVKNSLDFLESKNDGKGKVLDNFKRLEIALRKFMPRLEAIRREVPLSYESYVVKLLRYVREARAASVDPLFGNTVVPRQKPNE